VTVTARRGPTNGATAARPATRRVAIYTRQSVDRGDEYGSTQAQREAVEAYVASQKFAGWVATPEHFDDRGESGSTIDRPAFQRLLAEIDSGTVEICAVYKIDRLSRSLLDFTQLMKRFEEKGVEFVSVTQQFSTSPTR
jgi:site-specific DNA recombinase